MPAQKYHIDVKELHRLYVEEGFSTVAIAKQYNIYFEDGKPNAPAVQRMLSRANIGQRSKSQAQKLALDTGTAAHPTQGKPRPLDTRLAIGAGVAEEFKRLTKEEKQKRLEGLKKFWSDEDNKEEQEATRYKIGSQLRKAAVEGSYLERAIYKFLIQQGYRVEVHKKDGVFGNADLEADLVVTGKGISLVLEVDGFRHFKKSPNKGIAELAQIIQADQKKNGIVLAMKNVWLVRILYDFGSEITYVQATLQKVHEILAYIKKMKGQELKPKDRFIPLDMGLVLHGKSLTDNPDFKRAIALLKK
jgi:hypothetical protein